MSARPALTLVGLPVARPGPRALQFIAWAVDTFGERSTRAGQVVVRRSQSALVAAHDTVDSHGTVSWYMRQLRDAGVVVSDRPITVDVEQIARLTGGLVPGATDSSDGLDHGQAFDAEQRRVAANLGELLAQRAEQLARVAQLQAEIALTDAAIARALINVDAGREALAASREAASPAVAKSARDRESREPGFARSANQEGRKVDLDLLPSFSGSRVRESDSRIRDLAVADRLSLEDVDDIVEPLREVCRRTDRPDRLDDRGRRMLAQLGRDALTAGVEAFAKEVSADATIRKPMGVLVRRAEQCDPATFAHRPSAPERSGRRRHGPECDCGGTGFVPADADDPQSHYLACQSRTEDG